MSTDLLEVTAPITITVTATLDDYVAVTAATATFSVEILNPCLSTVLSFSPTISDMIAYMDQGASSQTLLAVDTESQANGGDGVTFCGARSYAINPSTYSPLTLTSDTLTLVSTNMAEVTVAPITITVTATLDNYPLVTAASATY